MFVVFVRSFIHSIVSFFFCSCDEHAFVLWKWIQGKVRSVLELIIQTFSSTHTQNIIQTVYFSSSPLYIFLLRHFYTQLTWKYSMFLEFLILFDTLSHRQLSPKKVRWKMSTQNKNNDHFILFCTFKHFLNILRCFNYLLCDILFTHTHSIYYLRHVVQFYFQYQGHTIFISLFMSFFRTFDSRTHVVRKKKNYYCQSNRLSLCVKNYLPQLPYFTI